MYVFLPPTTSEVSPDVLGSEQQRQRLAVCPRAAPSVPRLGKPLRPRLGAGKAPEISYFLPKGSDRDEGTLEITAGNRYHYLS